MAERTRRKAEEQEELGDEKKNRMGKNVKGNKNKNLE
jgi:hypothetical protein